MLFYLNFVVVLLWETMTFRWIIRGPHNGDPMGITLLKSETKQFAKQTSEPWKTLVNIRNDLYYTKSCKLWCLEDKRYIWTKIYIIIGYWALSTLSTQYTFDNYSINNNLNNLELILPKMLKTPGWKQKLGCL